MELNEYQTIAGKSIDTKETALTYFALGLSGETGEVIELIKKYVYRNKPIDRELFVEELGDVLWNISQLAAWLGINLEEIAVHNLNKQRLRYPERFKNDNSTD